MKRTIFGFTKFNDNELYGPDSVNNYLNVTQKIIENKYKMLIWIIIIITIISLILI